MTHNTIRLLAASGIAALFMIAAPATAAPVTVMKIGTWSTAPNAPNPGMLARGGKFVMTANYDTASIVATFNPRLFVADLTGPGASLQLAVPMQGFGGVVSTQTQLDNDNFIVPFPQIQFFDAAGTAFRGFDFSSSPLPGTTGNPGGGLYFDIFTSDTSFGGPQVTNLTTHISNGDGSFGLDITSNTVDVRTEDLVTASGGLAKPGVFLSDAVNVVAKAGVNLAYSASTLTVTTDGGTATGPMLLPAIPTGIRSAPSPFDDPTVQRDNDLGAGRTDGEDFLAFAWSIQGGGALGGTNATGTRINRVVQDSFNGPVFVNAGMRTVDDVNKTVGIADSGLTTTTDVKTWVVNVIEDITGKSGSDTLTVSYTNALPTIANATATASGPGNLDLNFALLGIDDADLALNASMAAFEELMKQIFVDGVDVSGFFNDLILTDAQSVGNAALVSQFGLGNHTFLARVTDRAGGVAEATFDFTVLAAPVGTVPEPSSLALIGIAVAGLVIATRRRPPAGKRA